MSDKYEISMLASLAILLISLWQLEILFAFSWDATFDLPFHLAKVDKWWVRDMFYGFIGLSWLLMYKLKRIDGELKTREALK